jgi:hypothetical protein
VGSSLQRSGLRRRARSPKAAALAALLALASAQLGAVAHAALAVHATCPEHGELIEASADARPASATDRTAPALEAAARADEHGHNHCALAPAAQARAVVSEPPSAQTGPQPETALMAALSAPLRARIEVLRLAPKASPPARA